jgi:hypothetical protein
MYPPYTQRVEGLQVIECLFSDYIYAINILKNPKDFNQDIFEDSLQGGKTAKTMPPTPPSPARGEGREGVISFGCGSAALYYCFAKSLNFVRHSGVGKASLKSPPTPL